MLSQLGMREELDKEGLLRVAGEIERVGDDEQSFGRARRILRYIKDYDRLVRHLIEMQFSPHTAVPDESNTPYLIDTTLRI